MDPGSTESKNKQSAFSAEGKIPKLEPKFDFYIYDEFELEAQSEWKLVTQNIEITCPKDVSDEFWKNEQKSVKEYVVYCITQKQKGKHDKAQQPFEDENSRFLIDKQAEPSEGPLTIHCDFYTEVHYKQSIADLIKRKENGIANPAGLFNHQQYYYLQFKKVQKELKKMEQSHNDAEEQKNQYYEYYQLYCILAFQKKDISETHIKQFIYTMTEQMKFSEGGIFCQVEQQFENIMFATFKDIIKELAKIQQIQSYDSIYQLINNLLFNQKSIYHVNGIKKYFSLDDIKNLVYKRMIQNGIFPIYMEINDMNQSQLKILFSNWVINLFFGNESVLPWSTKYHASLQIGYFHYNFTQNNIINISDLQQRSNNLKQPKNQNYDYLRFKILDFFPLDQWVESLASYFFIDLDYFEQELSQLVAHWNSQEPMDAFQSCGSLQEEALLQQNFHQNKTQGQFKFELLKIARKHNRNQDPSLGKVALFHQIIYNNKEQEDYTMTEENKDSSLGDNIKNSTITDGCINLQGSPKTFPNQQGRKQSSGDIDIIQKPAQQNNLIKAFQTFSKTKNVIQNNSNTQKKFVDFLSPIYEIMCSKFAIQFINNYYHELIRSQILQKFCYILADTEISQYNLFGNNCQTPPANFIYHIKETFNPVIEPLPKKQPNYNNYVQQLFHRREKLIKQVEKKSKQNEQNMKQSNILLNSIIQMPKEIIQEYDDEEEYEDQDMHKSLYGICINPDKEHICHEMFTQFIKFGSILDIEMARVIQPAILDKNLEYIQIYSDQFVKQMLIDIKKDLSLRPGEFFDKILKQDMRPANNANTKVEHTLLAQFENYQVLFKNLQQQINRQKISKQYIGLFSNKLSWQQSDTIFNKNYLQIDVDADIVNFRSSLSMKNNPGFCIPFYILNLEYTIFKMKKSKKINSQKKHELQDILKQLLFYYYNSVRAQNHFCQSNNQISYIGFLIIKDPTQYFKKSIVPHNFQKLIDNEFYSK